MEVTVTGIYDEGALEDTAYIGAKGFSVMIDAGGRKVLVDTGLRDRYLKHNLEQTDINLSEVEAVVITQSHPDNCRALDGFLDLVEGPVKVYAPEGLYDGKKGLFPGSVGLSEENRPKAEFDHSDGWIEVVPGVTLTPYAVSDNGYMERFIIIKARRTTVVSGRGVGGPSRALDMAKDRFGEYPEAFLGAVLLEKAKKPVAELYAEDFSSRRCSRLLLNHCTGRDGMVNLRTKLGLHGVDDFYVGSVYKG